MQLKISSRAELDSYLKTLGNQIVSFSMILYVTGLSKPENISQIECFDKYSQRK